MRTDDGYIINKCLQGEKEAFAFLVDKYKASVYAFSYHKLRDFHDAEDVTQEVFISAFKKLRDLRRWDSFHAWLYTITRNHCNLLIRNRAKRPDCEFIEDQKPEILEDYSTDLPQNDDIIETLKDALSSLPEMYSQVLTFHYIGGMTCKEIATFVGTSPTNVKKRLSRARGYLKEELINTMGTLREQYSPKAMFTFHTIEMIENIKIKPISRIPLLSWAASLSGGIMITALFFSQYVAIQPINYYFGSPLKSRFEILRDDEVSVYIADDPEFTTPSIQKDKGNALTPNVKTGKWMRKADMLSGRSFLSASVVNGKIYVFGGRNHDKIFTSVVEEYDPELDKWSAKSGLPNIRAFLSSATVNDRIYVIGGFNGNNDVSFVEEYNPQKDEWVRKNDMPTTRDGLVTCVVNNKIYAIGGVGGNSLPGQALPTVEEYDPETDTWIRKADMLVPRGGHSAVAINNKIYVFGGQTGLWGPDGGPLVSVVEEYDPLSDTWTKKSEMPVSRNLLSVSAMNGKAYIIGGAINMGAALPIVEEYDPIKNAWTKKPALLNGRCALSSVAMDGSIYAIGGLCEASFELKGLPTLEKYTPENLSFGVPSLNN